MIGTSVRTVLFDLDGTLLDTAPDMGGALNELLDDHAKPTLNPQIIRPHVSHGSRALIKLGFGIDTSHPSYARLEQGFLDHYARRLCLVTRLFFGMNEVLDHCENNGLTWGVVTNKPAYLTEPLLTGLDLLQRCACVVSGDTLPQRKPDPEPLLHGCMLAGGDPLNTLYIGDAERDIEAGRDAGMTTLVAGFGYIGMDDDPATWGADGIANTPHDILNWIVDSQ